MKRSKARENAVLAIYQMELVEIDMKSAIENTCEISNQFIEELIEGVFNNLEAIDSKLDEFLVKWKLDRIALLDKAILRVAAYELLFTETPGVICINEAIELAKIYSDDNMPKIINGVLDKIYNSQ